MEKCELPLPTTDAMEKKTKELEKAKTFEFTDKQIDQVMRVFTVKLFVMPKSYCDRSFKRRRSLEKIQGIML